MEKYFCNNCGKEIKPDDDVFMISISKLQPRMISSEEENIVDPNLILWMCEDCAKPLTCIMEMYSMFKEDKLKNIDESHLETFGETKHE